VSVALVIQHAMRMRRIIIRLYNIFPRYGTNSTIIGKSYLTNRQTGRQVGRWTDKQDEADRRFLNFANAPRSHFLPQRTYNHLHCKD